MDKVLYPTFPLADLHVHTRPSISPAVYWRLAHEQGIKLPKKDYEEFAEYITLSPEKKMTLNDYFSEIYHTLLYKLSSGTIIQERVFYEIFTGAYRNNVHLIELRTDIMKVNNNGEQDLDAIVMAMLRGMERALLEYPKLSAGLIFSLAREFSLEKNTIMIEKAIKYRKRGVVAIDFAGPATASFHYKHYKDIVEKAKKAGLKVTAHAGEIEEANDMWEALEFIQPQRIGHGIKAAYDKKLMAELAKREVVLEVCPMSNLMTKAVKNLEEIEWIFKTFLENKVRFTINTDWPEVIQGAHQWRQYQMLKENNILTDEQLNHCNKIAFDSTFIPQGGLNAYL
ncbi:MAG TPA: adenosine deaminase [Patescibacteria group bacterium]|nr:adenosine deaminase [Patescibacteria group bacterium]